MTGRIELTGQIITSVNFGGLPLFYFSPQKVWTAALNFSEFGIDKLEVPDGVLDPDNKTDGKGVDQEVFDTTLSGMPPGVEVIATYIGSQHLGGDNEEFLKQAKRKLGILFDAFPNMRYVMMHPHSQGDSSLDETLGVVTTWNKLADFAATKREGAQVCFHNHYDTFGETAEQVRNYLNCIRAASNPALRWGLDTGHLHSTGKEYFSVLEDNADLIGDYFHIKARNPALDVKDPCYDASMDPTGGKVYRGFVCPARVGVITKFYNVFEMIKRAKPDDATVYGAIEIDNPIVDPSREIQAAVGYLMKNFDTRTQRPTHIDDMCNVRQLLEPL